MGLISRVSSRTYRNLYKTMGIFKQWGKVATQMTLAAIGFYYAEKTYVSITRTPNHERLFDAPTTAISRDDRSKLLEAIQLAAGEKTQFEIDAENQKKRRWKRRLLGRKYLTMIENGGSMKGR